MYGLYRTKRGCFERIAGRGVRLGGDVLSCLDVRERGWGRYASGGRWRETQSK